MEILGDQSSNLDLLGIAGVPVCRNYYWAGSGPVRYSGNYEIVGADNHRRIHLAQPYSRTPKVSRPQAMTQNPDLASRQRCGRRQGLDVRPPVHVFLS
jgi:hypothetical protein